MRLRDIMSLGNRYLMSGIIMTLFIVGVFLVGYHIIYKKVLKGTKKIKLGTLCIYAIFICYLFVVFGTTLLSRGSMWQNHVQFHLFYSYREAWNDFSMNEWRHIILNIMMFVPFGLLLPIECKFFQKFWKTYLAGLGFSLMIEIIQYIFKRGICEVDDLFNNMLGAMIGYGLFSILFYIVSRVKKKEYKLLPVVLFQIPLLITVIMFATIFTIYSRQELGNLSSDYIYRHSNVEVSSTINFNDEEISMPVYQLQVASETETRKQAAELFKCSNSEINESRIDLYQDTAIYYNTTGDKSIWIDYKGSTSRYTDFDELYGDEESVGLENVAESEIRSAMELLNVRIPEEAIFVDNKDGEYEFIAEQILVDEVLYNGNLTCTYTTDKKISEFRNNIIEYRLYKEMPICSEKEAFEKIVEGKFKYSYSDEKIVAVVNRVKIVYQIDSKGYFQPVYIFDVTVNGEEGEINIPAIQ